MPRKQTKDTSASVSRSSSKRPASETPTRQSKRAKAATRKSYVEPDTDEEVAAEKSPEDVAASDASEFDDPTDEELSSDSPPEEPSSGDDGKGKKSTPRGQAGKKALSTRKKQAEGKDLWKQGAKLAPGTQIIIKKPKAREAGDTPYMDETIHPNTMLFLKDLAANNERQWLKLHDPDYRVALQDFTTFAEKVSEKVIEADGLIPELPIKDVIYRIYRDVRFSKDQTPYKSFFSAAWSRTGRKGPYAHYYMQVQPNGGTLVGGGFWQPEAAALNKLRRDIDRKPHKIKRILTEARFQENFLGSVTNNEKKAVKAFVNLPMNESNALKRNPKGYDLDHRDIELLRLRNFTVSKKLRDEEVTGGHGLQRVAEVVAAMVPFITYLNSVVMPDEESSEDDDDNDDDEEAQGDGDGDDADDGSEGAADQDD